jgi:hypothetical protein
MAGWRDGGMAGWRLQHLFACAEEKGFPVQISRVLPEAELRELLVRFHMLGLHRLDG